MDMSWKTNVVQVSYISAILLPILPWHETAWNIWLHLMASWEVTQWFVSRECLLVYNGKENSIKLSNQLFPKDLWIMECISLLLWAHHNSLYVCTCVCVSVYACLQICLCFCEWVYTFLSVCCCNTLCALKIECHKILFVCIILRKQGFYVSVLFDFYVILNHEKCRILKDTVNI